MKKLFLIGASAAVFGVSLAAPSSTNYKRLVAIATNPAGQKASAFYNDTPFNQYKYGAGTYAALEFERLKTNKNTWKLVISDVRFQLNDISTKRNTLQVIKDPVMEDTTTLYQITDGFFQGHFIEHKKFSDGSRLITMKTRPYVFYEAGRSRLKDKSTTYPLYTRLTRGR
jgi:hypothetical protein